MKLSFYQIARTFPMLGLCFALGFFIEKIGYLSCISVTDKMYLYAISIYLFIQIFKFLDNQK